MLRRHLVRVSIAAAFSLALSPAARALRPVSAEEAPKANAKLLRALGEGAQEVRVIVGVSDGTPSARALLERPDPAGEPAPRIRRLDAQKRLVTDPPQKQFRGPHFGESVAILSGTPKRAGGPRPASPPGV